MDQQPANGMGRLSALGSHIGDAQCEGAEPQVLK